MSARACSQRSAQFVIMLSENVLRDLQKNCFDHAAGQSLPAGRMRKTHSKANIARGDRACQNKFHAGGALVTATATARSHRGGARQGRGEAPHEGAARYALMPKQAQRS